MAAGAGLCVTGRVPGAGRGDKCLHLHQSQRTGVHGACTCISLQTGLSSEQEAPGLGRDIRQARVHVGIPRGTCKYGVSVV